MTVPPGSNYSPAEWEAARQLDCGPGGPANVVVEFRNQESALVAFKARPTRHKESVRTADGQMLRRPVPLNPLEKAALENDYLGELESHLLDGCLVLAPGAWTSHPQAFTGTMVLKGWVFGDRQFKLVRPAAQRDEPEKAYLFSKNLQFRLPAVQTSLAKILDVLPAPEPEVLRSSQEAAAQEGAADDEPAEEAERAQRPRGA